MELRPNSAGFLPGELANQEWGPVAPVPIGNGYSWGMLPDGDSDRDHDPSDLRATCQAERDNLK